MKKTTVYLPDELLIEIKALSKRQQQSEAETIRSAIASYVTLQRRPLPEIFGSGSGGRINAVDSEDWLRDHWRRNDHD